MSAPVPTTVQLQPPGEPTAPLVDPPSSPASSEAPLEDPLPDPLDDPLLLEAPPSSELPPLLDPLLPPDEPLLDPLDDPLLLEPPSSELPPLLDPLLLPLDELLLESLPLSVAPLSVAPLSCAPLSCAPLSVVTPLSVVVLPSAAPASVVEELQTPFSHSSSVPHAVPLGALGLEHVPLDGSHVPATWHSPGAGQVTGLDPVHTPAWHVLVVKQWLVPVHVVPAGSLENAVVDVPGAHTRHALAESTVPDA